MYIALHFFVIKMLSLFQVSVREHFLPTLTTFVDFSQDGSTMKVPSRANSSRAVSRMNNLPSRRSDLSLIQRLHSYS